MSNIATTEIKKQPTNIDEYYTSLGVRKETPKPMLFEEFKKEFNKENEELANYTYLLYMRETDTNKDTDSVSEQLIRQGSKPAHLPKNWQVINSRLYQFGTKPNSKKQVIFGTIFEIGYEKESNDLIVIKKMLERELNNYEKMKENESNQGKLVLDKAIENIKETDIYKIEPLTTISEKKEITKIYRNKICSAKELLKCQGI